MKKLVCLLSILLTLAGCVTTNLPPATSESFIMEDDEKRFWLRSDEEQEKLNKSGLIYRDDELETYLNGIAKKLQPSEVFKKVPFKIIIIKAPYLNAFAYPNGVVYVHTGIIAKMENEAQFAAVLGHEMTHATHRHLVKVFRNMKNKSAFFTTMSIGLPVFGSVIGAIGTVASVSGYSRELKAEADMEGFKLVVTAGYAPEEAVKIFTHLKKEVEEEKAKEPFFFGSHPKLKERIDSYERLLKTEYKDKSGGVKNTEIFLVKTSNVILDNARLDLKIGRFKIAQNGIEKYLHIKPNDAQAYYILGETFRQRGEKGDMDKAKEYFEKAISLDSSYPEPHKAIGLIYYKRGEKLLANKYLRLYLTLLPDVSDRSYIEELLKMVE